MNENQKILMCECSGEALLIEMYQDTVAEHKFPKEFWFSLYRLGDYKPTLKNKIKWAWKMLRTGNLYSDSITLSEENVAEMIKFLNKKLFQK